MSQAVEENLQLLLNGSAINEDVDTLCDFTLEEQNAVFEAQGIQPLTSSDFTPVLGTTVTFIVACVLINEQNEVLMIQEAKKSCAGKWYLPAGRMEANETIIEAAVREVAEETGLNIEVTTLLGLECAGGSWYRFICTGRVLGGELKTPNKADAESLQAKWVADLNELNLRANDILPLIDLGRNYHRFLKNKEINRPLQWHNNVLPAQKSHLKNYLRVVAVIKKRTNNRVNILLSEKNVFHFPSVEIHHSRSIHGTLRKFMIELFGAELPQHRPHGVLSIEHLPKQATNSAESNGSLAAKGDGICITILCLFRPPLEEVSILKSKCIWHEVSKQIDDRICEVLSAKNTTLALHVVR
ncbi:8-oxo-dGDP phosphatase NUDT18 [Contarinia nasturtii]|uniref:8-oxo-dGDP phosphatase NUDT18 n=1 Tax=Contarinia nasturtii TaxID=265458 RepID=UPI0012D3824C|nr:8-oxo-dGDP phosphatase NUDT18 [Contarinia nasturtii]